MDEELYDPQCSACERAQADYADLEREADNLVALVLRLARALRKAAPADELPAQALDYLNRNGLKGSPLREVGADGAATVTKEMIGAAHDVMLAKGDFILSANLLERIFLAMLAARPQEKVGAGETATEGHNV